MRNLIIILLLSVSTLGFAQSGIPDAPTPPRLVTDLTGGTLSNQELRALENKMLGYEDSTSTQVAILIVASLGGYEVVDFAQRTGEKWRVGTSRDNGVFIVVSINDRKAAIVTGYGMEGSITDAATFTLREDYMNPRFQEGNFYKGLDDATTAIFKLASGEFKAEEFGQNRKKSGEEGEEGFPFFILFILFFFIIPAIVSKRRKGAVGSRRIPWWTWMMMGNSMGNNQRRGSGGGGFGGFGGGSFGGGGSGGSW